MVQGNAGIFSDGCILSFYGGWDGAHIGIVASSFIYNTHPSVFPVLPHRPPFCLNIYSPFNAFWGGHGEPDPPQG